MAVEIPQFRKCCFCLPLRPGLLAWGYFKIVADLIITPFLAYFLLGTVVMSLYGGNKRYVPWILLYAAISLIIVIMLITDFVASILFVIAGHKKNVSMIRGFYIYSIVTFILTALLVLLGVFITIIHGLPNSPGVSAIMFAGFLIILVVQAYFVLLLRSEVIKLNASGQFKFVNNAAAEAQCMMTAKQNEAARESI